MNKDEQLGEQAANAQELELQRHELERQPESSSANAQREKEYLLSKALVLKRLKQTFPGVNLSLMVTIKTLKLSPQAKGTAMSMVEPFSQAEGITMIVIDPFSRAICTLLKIVGPFSQANSACPI